jgi:hypothetical protein
MYGIIGTLVLIGLIVFLLVERRFFPVNEVPAVLPEE